MKADQRGLLPRLRRGRGPPRRPLPAGVRSARRSAQLRAELEAAVRRGRWASTQAPSWAASRPQGRGRLRSAPGERAASPPSSGVAAGRAVRSAPGERAASPPSWGSRPAEPSARPLVNGRSPPSGLVGGRPCRPRPPYLVAMSRSAPRHRGWGADPPVERQGLLELGRRLGPPTCREERLGRQQSRERLVGPRSDRRADRRGRLAAARTPPPGRPRATASACARAPARQSARPRARARRDRPRGRGATDRRRASSSFRRRVSRARSRRPRPPGPPVRRGAGRGR